MIFQECNICAKLQLHSSLAQKFLMSLKSSDVSSYDDTTKFFGKDATKFNIKRDKCFKVNKIKGGDFIRAAQMVK